MNFDYWYKIIFYFDIHLKVKVEKGFRFDKEYISLYVYIIQKPAYLAQSLCQVFARRSILKCLPNSSLKYFLIFYIFQRFPLLYHTYTHMYSYITCLCNYMVITGTTITSAVDTSISLNGWFSQHMAKLPPNCPCSLAVLMTFSHSWLLAAKTLTQSITWSTTHSKLLSRDDNRQALI